MAINRYDPFREALSLRNAIDQLFSQSFVSPAWYTGNTQGMAPMNVHETENGYQVDVSLPGVKPEDIDLTVHQNTLTVKGHYSYQNQQGQPQNQPSQNQQGQQQETQQGQQNWLMREIRSGAFERTVTFPKPIDADKIETHYEHGILTISVPISEASRPKKISVKSGQGQPVTVEADKK